MSEGGSYLSPIDRPLSTGTGNDNIYEETYSVELENQYSSICDDNDQETPVVQKEAALRIENITKCRLFIMVSLIMVVMIFLAVCGGLVGYFAFPCSTNESKEQGATEIIVKNTDSCDVVPCQNGDCFEDRCSCFPGYEGSHCEYDIDECVSSPCGNHGTCIDGNGTYSCVCEPDFDGPNCLVEWTLVFRGTAGAGSDVYRVWVDGEDATTNDVECMTTDVTSCNKHYRHPRVDTWTSINITKVKLSFINNNTEMAYIVFNASRSGVKSWFARKRVIESSWTNLATDRFQLFSLFGNDPWRRFLISRYTGKCSEDAMYTATIVPHHYDCSYDQHLSYPQFLYSTTNSYGYPEENQGFAAADVMAIFIQY